MSEDIPTIQKPILRNRLPLLSIQVVSPERDSTKKKVTELYTKYLTESGYFDRVVAEGIRTPYHIDLYTSEVNEYEHFWVSSISTLFMIGTVGLLPSIYSKERVLVADIYINERWVGRERYKQKHTTLFGIPFLFIWEKGILESKTIAMDKEKNMIHNLIQDLNRYF